MDYEIIHLTKFNRDVKRQQKRGLNLDRLELVVAMLSGDKQIPSQYKDHPLRGIWHGCRELHIAPDWILIYRIFENKLELIRTGSHTDLFD